MSLFGMLYFLVAAWHDDFALCHPFLDYLVEGELGWFCFGGVVLVCCCFFLASRWLFRIKNLFSSVLGKQQHFASYKGRAAAFQGIPFNFLAGKALSKASSALSRVPLIGHLHGQFTGCGGNQVVKCEQPTLAP